MLAYYKGIEEMEYQIKITENFRKINWHEVTNVIEIAGLGKRDPEKYKTACENSYKMLIVYHNDKMIGTGRIISDGVFYSTIADVTVLPEYQRRGICTAIMKRLHGLLPSNHCLIYTDKEKIPFYQNLGYYVCSAGMLKPMNTENLSHNKYILYESRP